MRNTPARRIALALCCCWAACLAPEAAQAQPQTAWWQTWQDPALDGLVEAALAANGSVQAAQARMAAAGQQVEAGRAYYLPNASVDPLVQQQSLAPNRPLPVRAAGTRLLLNSLALPLNVTYDVNFWQKRTLVALAQNQAEQQGQNLAQTRLALAGQVVQAVVAVRAADLALGVLQRSQGLLDSVQRILEARYRAGLSNEVPVVLNRTQLQALALDVETSQRSRATALAQLEALTNRPGLAVAPLPGPPLLPVLDSSGAAAALGLRPDVQLFDFQLREGRLTVQQLDHARLPRPCGAAPAGVITQFAGEVFHPESFTYTVAAGVNIPLWDWANNRYNVRAARHEADARRALARQQRLDAQAQVRAAYTNAQATQAQLRAVAQALGTAERGVRLAAELYTKGLTTFLELLQAQQNLIALQTRQAQLQGQYLAFVADYWVARGGR